MKEKLVRSSVPLLGCILLLSACADDMHATYATYEEAREDGAIRRGWIPNFVPVSATNLQESHNLDTNERWLRFQCDAPSLKNIRKELIPILPDQVQLPRLKSTRIRPWWPDALRRLNAETQVLYDFYRWDYESAHMDPQKCVAYVAIEKGAPQVWFWESGT